MSEKGVKRKKKHGSFLSKMKKYHRKGSAGRGFHIEDETYQYFVRMYEVQSKGFDAEDDKKAFVNNFFEEIKGHEVEYSKNQIGSRLIEALLPTATSETLKNFADAFDEVLRPLCCDEFASHIIEALLKIAAERSRKVSKSDDDAGDAKYSTIFREWVMKMAKFMLNNLEDFVWDLFANHILRTVFACLVGSPDAKSLKAICGKATENLETNQQDVEFSNLLKEFARRLVLWPQFSDLAYEELTSGLLQTLLLALHKAASKSVLKNILSTLLDECYMKQSTDEMLYTDCSESDLDKKKLGYACMPSIFDYPAAVHLFEVMIFTAPPKLYTQMFAKLCMNRLKVLATDKRTNFIVQKLLHRCQESADFESIFVELESSLESILEMGFSGVILTLCQASQRLVVKQSQILQSVMKTLHCHEPKDRQTLIVPLVASLKTYESYTDEKEAGKGLITNMHGCLILQSMLSFNKPILIVNSLLSMNQEELVNLFSNDKGSHIAEAFLQSQTVGVKSREKLIKALQGSYSRLASTKHGSWVFEAIFNVADPKQKTFLMEELLSNHSSLKSTEYGQIVANKMNLLSFQNNRQAWTEAQSRDVKKKKFIEGML